MDKLIDSLCKPCSVETSKEVHFSPTLPESLCPSDIQKETQVGEEKSYILKTLFSSTIEGMIKEKACRTDGRR